MTISVFYCVKSTSTNINSCGTYFCTPALCHSKACLLGKSVLHHPVKQKEVLKEQLHLVNSFLPSTPVSSKARMFSLHVQPHVIVKCYIVKCYSPSLLAEFMAELLPAKWWVLFINQKFVGQLVSSLVLLPGVSSFLSVLPPLFPGMCSANKFSPSGTHRKSN